MHFFFLVGERVSGGKHLIFCDFKELRFSKLELIIYEIVTWLLKFKQWELYEYAKLNDYIKSISSHCHEKINILYYIRTG